MFIHKCKLTRDIDMAILAIWTSVCLWHLCTVSKQLNIPAK